MSPEERVTRAGNPDLLIREHRPWLDVASNDPALIHKITAVFARWPARPTEAPLRCHADYIAEPGQAPAWEVRQGAGDAPVRCRSRDQAVALLETAALGTFVRAQAPHTIPFHGGLLATSLGGLVVLGAPRTGKSTLAFALWQRGWTFFSDDTVIVDPGAFRAWPSPRRVHLRVTSEPLVGADITARLRATPAYGHNGHTHHFHPIEVDGQPRPASVPISCVLVLDRVDAPSSPADLKRIPAAKALLALLPFSVALAALGLGAAIARAEPLADGVPVYALSRGPLAEMVAVVEGLIAPATV